MEKFRKKPIIVEAEQWFSVTYDGIDQDNNPTYHLDVGYFRHPEISGKNICQHCGKQMHDHGWMDTLEGEHNVCPGDWIIKGIKGEMYPCKPDIFKETYDLVEE